MGVKLTRPDGKTIWYNPEAYVSVTEPILDANRRNANAELHLINGAVNLVQETPDEVNRAFTAVR